jgi:hypothetical protein
MIEFIDKQQHIFYIKIAGEVYHFHKMSLYKPNQFIPLAAKVKGSTLGWYVKRHFVSYNQIRAAIRLKQVKPPGPKNR